jgi:hypothetical protein
MNEIRNIEINTVSGMQDIYSFIVAFEWKTRQDDTFCLFLFFWNDII